MALRGSDRSRRTLDEWAAVADLGVAPDAEIARRLGCAESTVARARHALGIGRSTHHASGAVRWDRVDWTLSDLVIAAQMGTSRGSVRRARAARGEAPSLARQLRAPRLSAADAINIRAARQRGVPLRDLAERYGVGESTISMCARRRTLTRSGSGRAAGAAPPAIRTPPLWLLSLWLIADDYDWPDDD